MPETAVQTIPNTSATPAVTPMAMLQMAVEQGADLDKLTKLMDLQERWEANEARKAFVVAMTAFKSKPPQIVKNRNIQHGDKLIATYAGLDQVSSVIGEALAEFGVSHRWDMEQTDAAIIVTCILTHEKGHSERTTLRATADTSGSKNAVQAIASTVTYLQRYTLLAATGMSTGEEDDDGKGLVSTIIDAQKAELVDLQGKAGANTVKFLAHFKIGAIEELPAGRFDEAKRLLEGQVAARAKSGGVK